jgi:hypothetical protein
MLLFNSIRVPTLMYMLLNKTEVHSVPESFLVDNSVSS